MPGGDLAETAPDKGRQVGDNIEELCALPAAERPAAVPVGGRPRPRAALKQKGRA